MGKLSVIATKSNLDEVMDFVDSCLEAAEFSPKKIMQVDLAVEEIFCNIADYAYGSSNGGLAVLECSLVETDNVVTAVQITFSDDGLMFNPIAKSDPNTSLDVDDRSIGGLGIFITKKMVDEISYKYKDNKNVLTLIKYK